MSRRLSPIADVAEKAPATELPISPLAGPKGENVRQDRGGASRRPYADRTGSSVTL
ncbi:hypothetical protein SAMN03159463_01887 [Mesorhizobium sp. NFR06]|nr:hypothetical protein SAMN03159463_01887 [Mesorhizobium sp. NFR06]